MIRHACSAAVLIVIAALAVWAAKPDLSGRWIREEAGQRMSLQGPRDLVLTIRHQEPRFRYRAVGVMGMNTPFVEEREFTTEGKSSITPGDLAAEGRWEGAELVIRYSRKGQDVAVVRMSMSPDGKRLTRRIELAGRAPIVEKYSRQ